MVSTVGPGKDYATLAAWKTARAGAGDADETANCFAGADLGAVTVDWSLTGTTTITVDASSRHNGTDAGHAGVAYTTGNIQFTDVNGNVTVDHLRCEGSLRYSQTTSVFAAVTFLANLFVHTGSGINAGMRITVGDFDGSTPAVQSNVVNNLMYWKTTTSGGVGILLTTNSGDGSGETSFPATISGNTVIRTAGLMTAGIRVQAGSDTGEYDIRQVNNIVLSNTTCYSWIDGGTLSDVGVGHNLSSDATADDYGAVGGDFINAVAASVVVDPATNATLLPTSAALDVGFVEAITSPDAIGTIRPQGSAYDLGALEFIPPTPPSNKGVSLRGILNSHVL